MTPSLRQQKSEEALKLTYRYSLAAMKGESNYGGSESSLHLSTRQYEGAAI